MCASVRNAVRHGCSSLVCDVPHEKIDSRGNKGIAEKEECFVHSSSTFKFADKLAWRMHGVAYLTSPRPGGPASRFTPSNLVKRINRAAFRAEPGSRQPAVLRKLSLHQLRDS